VPVCVLAARTDERAAIAAAGRLRTLRLVSTTNDECQWSLTALASAVDAASDPLQRLTALRALTDFAAEQVQDAARTALDSGVSVAAVGRALSITRQAAHKRFVPLDGRAGEPAKRRRTTQSPVWGELRIGPGRGVRAGRILRRP
jgi:hypothetical protein